MNIIQVKTNDRGFKGEILIIETSKNQIINLNVDSLLTLDENKLSTKKSTSKKLKSNKANQNNSVKSVFDLPNIQCNVGRFIRSGGKNLYPERQFKLQETDTINVLYDNPDFGSEYIRTIQTDNFISDYNNDVEVWIRIDNFPMTNKIRLVKTEDLTPTIKKCLYAECQFRPSRTIYHRELPFLINYALNKHSLSILSRKFITDNLTWSNTFDLWIINQAESLELVKVIMHPTINNVDYDSFILDPFNIENQIASKNIKSFIGIKSSPKTRISVSMDSFMTGNLHPEIKFSQFESYSYDYNYYNLYTKLYNWIINICNAQTCKTLFDVIYDCINSNRYSSDDIINIIISYVLIECLSIKEVEKPENLLLPILPQIDI